jgi:hypothetical protein
MLGESTGDLQGQSGGEQPLDDEVVHVPGDPLPVLQEQDRGPVTLGP